ncbi:MAG TPA: Crp/Fnr family transcriptional regulator [Gemmatimonadaceae bacterium]
MQLVSELRQSSPALAELPPAVLDQIGRAVIDRRYRANDVIYRAGEIADGLYFVLAGKILVQRETVDRVAMLHTEGPGGVLGEIPVFGGGRFPATATAVEVTRCAQLSLTVVERLLRDNPEFARFSLRRLAVRAQSLLKRIDELTTTTIVSRLASHLLVRANVESRTGFTLGMSQAALAAELGTAREVVVRALGSLVEAGAIARTGRSRFAVSDARTLCVLTGSSTPVREREANANLRTLRRTRGDGNKA